MDSYPLDHQRSPPLGFLKHLFHFHLCYILSWSILRDLFLFFGNFQDHLFVFSVLKFHSGVDPLLTTMLSSGWAPLIRKKNKKQKPKLVLSSGRFFVIIWYFLPSFFLRWGNSYCSDITPSGWFSGFLNFSSSSSENFICALLFLFLKSSIVFSACHFLMASCSCFMYTIFYLRKRIDFGSFLLPAASLFLLVCFVSIIHVRVPAHA